MATTVEGVELLPLVDTKEELIRCFDRLERYLYPFSDGDEDLSDEDAMLHRIESVQSDDTAERLMQGKRDDQALSQDQIVWEVMTDLLLATFSNKALMKVLSTNDYSYQSKYKLADCLLSRPAQVDFKATDSEGQTALHLAIYEFNESAREDEDNDGDLYYIVNSILSHCPTSVNVKDQFGDTPLLTACRVLDGDCHSATLCRMAAPEFGANIHVVNPYGENVLHILAGGPYDNFVTVKYLCDLGVSVNAQSKDGCRPLHAAANSGENVESAKHLLEEGADINAIDSDKRTALHLAVKSRCYDMVSLLIEKGADVGLKDLVNFTPLDLAAEIKCEDTFDLLCHNEKSSRKDEEHKKKVTRFWNASRVQDSALASEIRKMSHEGVVQMIFKSNPRRKKRKPSTTTQESTKNFDFFEMIDEIKIYKESTKAVLDQIVLGKRRVNCKIFNADSKGNFPGHKKFNPRTSPQSLLDAIVKTDSTDLALHPAVKAVVDHQWITFFRLLFRISFLFYLLRTLLFTSALLIAARPDLDNPGCYRGGWDVVRGILEGLTLILFLAEIVYVCIELIVFVSTRSKIRDKSAPDPQKKSWPFWCRFPVRYSRWISRIKLETHALLKGPLLRVLAVVLPVTIIPFRAATIQCASTGEGYCALPVINSTTGNYSTDINVPCTVASHVQWIVSALAFLVNAILILEYLALFKSTGVYVRILIKIVKSDILKFSILYLVFLGISVCSVYFFLRGGVVITLDGQLISDVKLFAPNVPYPADILLFGVRMLMESGGITRGYFTDDDNIMYNGYQWFLVITYATFLLFMSVVLLSLLISQMSHSYSRVQEDAKGTFALARARVVVKLQKIIWFFGRKCLLSDKLDIKKELFKDYIWIVPEETQPRIEKENTTTPKVEPKHLAVGDTGNRESRSA